MNSQQWLLWCDNKLQSKLNINKTNNSINRFRSELKLAIRYFANR